MNFRNVSANGRAVFLFFVIAFLCVSRARAQGPAPETAAPLFPGGALVSYNSIFTTRGPILGALDDISATSRPTFFRQGNFIFTWGFFRNFDLTVTVPVVTNDFKFSGTPTVSGTGLGDSLILVKYRFYRKDSERGTTQASVTFGPKIPTGRTDLRAPSSSLLPAGLQPGSGSTDYFLAGYFTYTGLFNIRRLVADEAFTSLLTTEGSQHTRLGDNLESRFWLSYRPFESQNVGREWFIGPDLIWLYSQDDRVTGVTQTGSGGNALLAGVTTYVGVRPGMHLWLGMDWDVAHSTSALFMPVRRRISFGITQQFRIHL